MVIVSVTIIIIVTIVSVTIIIISTVYKDDQKYYYSYCNDNIKKQ